ncbi:hypothetical protein FBY21_1616 [Pseudomonas sp. SLBN-26]|uniref:hypothetical protein n=1 Tax=Pseudomonadaceae TaxID=135621 RepID=UPI00114FB12D|nr:MULTISPECIES: hypothetical protein [Pseudomonas]MCP1617015.1 hypothetical protein [Pseudomonas otitidis]TQL06259.1 hypothetical protein FBY21_1616 [Pseudomonas sp. SLBN-26]
MVAFYWLTLGYVVAPVLLGLLCRSLVKHQLVPDFFNRAPARFRALDQKVLLAGGIVVFLGLTGIVAGHKALGGDAPFWVMTIAPLAMYICTARLFYLRFKPQILKFSATRLAKWLFALLVFIAVWVSNVYTDSIFLHYTRIAPSDLPAAKTGVLAIVTVFVWVTLISLLTLVPYLLIALALGAMTPKKAAAEAVMCLSPASRQSPPSPPFAVTLILFGGLAFSSITPLNLLDYTSRNPELEPFVRKLIVFASFHLKDSQCTNNQPEGSRFAPLGYERLAVAIPDEEKGYLFKTLKCPNGDAAKAPEKKPQVSVPLEFDQQAL